MRVKINVAALALALLSCAGSACAMNAGADPNRCRVVNADRLPPGSGGADALCTAIRQAAEAEGIADAFSVEVQVVSRSMLRAAVTTSDGRRLPEQTLATADRDLHESAIRRFAQALARAIGEAS